MFWPLCSIGCPSTSQPSAPFGNRIRRGARSRHCAGTYSRQPSGGVSTCPSPEITWYVRAMTAPLGSTLRRAPVWKDDVVADGVELDGNRQAVVQLLGLAADDRGDVEPTLLDADDRRCVGNDERRMLRPPHHRPAVE